MASVSVFDLTRFTSLAAGDVLPAVDISNTTQNAHGSLLSITVTNFFGTVPVPVIVTSSSANAMAVGRQGTTDPAFLVATNTASSATGLKVTAAAAAGGLAVAVISSGTNENLTVDAKGSGTVTIGGTSTGGIVLARAVTLSVGGTVTTGGFVVSAGGVTVTGNSSVTGTLGVSALLTASGGATVASGQTLTLTGATIAGTPTWSSSQAITLSTAAQPNITSVGTLTSLVLSGALTLGTTISNVSVSHTAAGIETFNVGTINAGEAYLVSAMSSTTGNNARLLAICVREADGTYRETEFVAVNLSVALSGSTIQVTTGGAGAFKGSMIRLF